MLKGTFITIKEEAIIKRALQEIDKNLEFLNTNVFTGEERAKVNNIFEDLIKISDTLGIKFL